MIYIGGLTQEQLLALLNSKEEMQALLFIGLCCLGAWMVISWMVQLLRSILWIWPLLLVAGVLIAVPSLRITLTQEIIPKHVDDLIQILDKRYSDYSNDTPNWY